VSAVGCGKDAESIAQGDRCYQEMLRRLQPKEVLVYANKFEEGLEGNVRFIKYNIDKHIKEEEDDD
jgi:hypothetical protein